MSCEQAPFTKAYTEANSERKQKTGFGASRSRRTGGSALAAA